MGAYSTNSYATQAMGNVLWDAFNITNLAKEWKNGTQNPQCGFVLISDSTTIRTATYGGEYGTIDYRPYVVVNYSNMITLDHTSASVYKGDTLTLSATTIPAGQTVTWDPYHGSSLPKTSFCQGEISSPFMNFQKICLRFSMAYQ